VKLSHDGLTLWYGTPDAPAPLNEVVPPSGASIVVGVNPANPTNHVHVRYRVDGGITRIAPGRSLRTDDAHATQYFLVPLPPLPAGSAVDYAPVFGCGGRQVPAPGQKEHFVSSFTVATPPPPAPDPPPRASGARLAPELQHIATATIQVDRPVFIGETPEGVRYDFFALGGTVKGPRLNGRVLARSSDHLFVRPDGVAVLRVRAMIETDDGAMLEVEYTGSLDFGRDGYRRAVDRDLPTRATYVIAPRYLTAHPRYEWLNRQQCLGVGRIRLDDAVVEYDAYSVGVRPAGDAARRA
jgi:hypothetical protein